MLYLGKSNILIGINQESMEDVKNDFIRSRTLHKIEDYYIFTTFSFLIRGLEALGASAYSTAGYVIIINIFPDNAGAVRVIKIEYNH